MKITVTKGKQNKIHIYCDGEYSFTVDAEYWFSSPYHGKDTIDSEESTAFYDAVGSRCAFIAGLRLLSYRDHSEKELIMKLVFSTKNVSCASFLDMCQYAYDYGYAGFEIFDEDDDWAII